ncbi:MAG TPA: AhpC/TSA family protein [Bacteriovoracaceae bacterium]|nr:AhpC/TSA family protein [Bacteriovoracaceae bacterium]
MDQLWQQKASFDKKTTRIVFIGNGSPLVIESFMSDLKLHEPAHIYTDSSLHVFDACGMIRGIFHLIDPRGLKRMFEFGLQGYRQGPIDKRSGSHTQMGGIVAFKQTGEVIYHYLEDYLGDFDYKFSPDIVRGEKDEIVNSNPSLSPPNQFA